MAEIPYLEELGYAEISAIYRTKRRFQARAVETISPRSMINAPMWSIL